MKIYKKSLLYGALAFTLCMAGGCNSNIDLEPEGIITADGYFKSAEDYEKALTALYERLNVESYDLWMDGVTDNGLVTHSWNRGYDLGRGIGSTASSFPADKWDKGYISVQRANNVINNIDKYQWKTAAKLCCGTIPACFGFGADESAHIFHRVCARL